MSTGMGTAAEQLHAAAQWYLEDGTEAAREALAAGAARFMVEGDKVAAVLLARVDALSEAHHRDNSRWPIGDWHREARAVLGLDPLVRRVEYDGSFELAWLGDGEMVSSAGDGTGACIVTSKDGTERRINIGDEIEVLA